jgi:enoyl-CoA hydratase/carnithine racemase
MAENDDVLVEQHGAVVLLTLNRPDRLNAWTYELGDRYFDLLDDADASPDVRVIVVTGAGRGFCAGMDTTELSASAGGVRKMPAKGRRMTHAADIAKPMVAAINGPCVGFGLVQALHCDVRFAAESAVFASAFTNRGLNAEYGVSWLLPRIVGHTRATEMLLSGRRVAADEAERIGLVNWVVPADELVPRALDYARGLAERCSPVAMADTKHQISADWLLDRVTAEDEAKRISHSPGHRVDFEEGVRSFVEKRPPRFAPWTHAHSSRADGVRSDDGV